MHKIRKCTSYFKVRHQHQHQMSLQCACVSNVMMTDWDAVYARLACMLN